MSVDQPDLVPARMLNEYVYCPRLGYLMWADSEFADSADTVDGRRVHKRVDREGGELPEAEDCEEQEIHARSLWLSAPGEGLTARMDLVEGQGRDVTPVDYKRGRVPDIPEKAWEPERVQLCAQVLVLRENGYRCDKGLLYYVESKTRVEVPITPELEARTREAMVEFRTSAAEAEPPPPLMDSPKCPRCSLVGICLPDEVNLLAGAGPEDTDEVRRLYPARDDALPLYIQTQGARVGKSGERLQVKSPDGTKQELRLLDV
ncbi:MAG: CRISPR-associated protein Cas4, partial [Pseudomonadota bacterium]